MYDENPRDTIGRALPDTVPPPNIDLDKVITDGYRARRRGRAMVGGAAAAGVTAVAGAIALVISLSPGDAVKGTDVAEDPETVVSDFEMAGYPYPSPEEGWANEEERVAVSEALRTAFGDLLVDAEVVSEAQLAGNEATEEEIQALAEEEGISLEMAGDILRDEGLSMPLETHWTQNPGNYGQVQLRSYKGHSGVQADESDTAPLTVEVLLPGGWTAEPGPITEQVFPQHIISADDAYYGGEGSVELATTDLDDGRRLIVGEHECAYDAAVIYPNGTGLKAHWDMGCGEMTSEDFVELGDFTDAVLAMPELELDTSDLVQVEEVVDVPTGWLATEWQEIAEVADAEATANGAIEVLEGRYPGSQLYNEAWIERDDGDLFGDVRGATMPRSYKAIAHLAYEADGSKDEFYSEITYYLPGGWLPGLNAEGTDGPRLISCGDKLSPACEQTEVDGMTVVTEQTDQGGDDYDNTVTVFHPDGWAVSFLVSVYDGAPAPSLDEMIEAAAALPAPVYDTEAQPTVPE